MHSCLSVRNTTCGSGLGTNKPFLGIIASGILIYLSYLATPKLPPLCLVLEDQFDTIDPQTWNREIDLGGFGYASSRYCKSVYFACSSYGIEMDNLR